MPVLPVSRQKRPEGLSGGADNGCYGKFEGTRFRGGGASFNGGSVISERLLLIANFICVKLATTITGSWTPFKYIVALSFPYDFISKISLTCKRISSLFVVVK